MSLGSPDCFLPEAFLSAASLCKVGVPPEPVSDRTDMNSVPRRLNPVTLGAMIVGGLLAIAPLFGPLGETLHYLDDFFAERPQSMRGPDNSFYVEMLALIVCPFGLIIFAISLVFFIRGRRRSKEREGNDPSGSR